MLEILKKVLLQMGDQRNHYFRDSKSEIARNNIILIMSISAGGLPIFALLLGITPLVVPDWYVTIGHWLFIPFFLCFLLLGTYLYKHKKESYQLVHIAVIAFLMIFMALVIYINTVPYPDSSATLVTAAMITLPVLFIVPFHETIIMEIIIFLVFLQMNSSYIIPERRGDNVFNGVAGMILGVLVAWVVTNLRAVDNRDKLNIVKQSNQDKLTGIQNKSAVEKSCFSYLENCGKENCALIAMDIDNFKSVNDSHGHHVGDEVLSIFGNTMKQVFRETDIYGRIGGDEFLVLMKSVLKEQLVEAKMASLSALFHQEVFEKLNIDVTCSYGAILKREEYISYVPLFNMADKILYMAKRNGKNQGDVLTIPDFEKYMSKKEIMLVVDDMDINRQLLTTTFEKDFEIIEAANGQEAIDMIRKHHSIIRIMLLDIMMPDVDGFEVLSWMKEQNLSSQFPIIAISSDEEKELKALELGVADMISKPFVPEVLKKRVDNALS